MIVEMVKCERLNHARSRAGIQVKARGPVELDKRGRREAEQGQSEIGVRERTNKRERPGAWEHDEENAYSLWIFIPRSSKAKYRIKTNIQVFQTGWSHTAPLIRTFRYFSSYACMINGEAALQSITFSRSGLSGFVKTAARWVCRYVWVSDNVSKASSF